jgi:hypothetical protein
LSITWGSSGTASSFLVNPARGMADRGALLRLRRLRGVELPSRSSMRPARLCRAMTPPTWFGRAPCQQRPAGKKRRFQPGPRPPQRRRLLQRGSAGALRPRNQLVARAPRRPSASRSLPWQTARRSRKSRLHAGGAPEPCRGVIARHERVGRIELRRRKLYATQFGEDGATRRGQPSLSRN